MTLREDIHAAIDEIAPAAPALAGQVAASIGTIAHMSQDLAREAPKFGNPAAPRERLVRNGLADHHKPMGRRTELAAGIAAVVLAAIVVGTFAYIRVATRPHTIAPPITSASPSPQALNPSPSPLSQLLKVDPATPVILFSDPAIARQIDGMTWDGQRAGKITQIPASVTNEAGSFSPAGTLIAMFPDIFDRSGRVVATLTGGTNSEPGVGELFLGTWADDELHYCQVVPIFGGTRAVTGTLQLTTPGGQPRDVAQVGMQAPGTNTLTVTVCSMLADRAIVVEQDPNPAPDGSNMVNQYWVVQLSTGRILWTHDLRGTNTANVVASRDGRYVAELESNGSTNIYGPAGSLVGHMTGSIQNFSWDGSLAVVTTPGGVACHCTSSGPVSVIRWGSGTVIWTAPAGQVLGVSQPEPGGGSLAIQTSPGTLATGQYLAPIVLYVVSSDGQVVGQRELGPVYVRSTTLPQPTP